jgi:hypothetical protein
MTDTDTDPIPQSDSQVENANLIETAINILTSPREAFITLNAHPTKLFPVAVVLLSVMAATGWYFAILDYPWYIDDTLGQIGNLSEEQLEGAREAMQSISQRNMTLLGIFGSAFSILAVYTLQASYLSLVSALAGDTYKFSHWFSLISWTNLPYLLVVISMLVNISLNPNGQLSAYDLNALSLSNLGMQSANASLNQMFSSLNLTMFWSLILVIIAYKQWLQSSLVKAVVVVMAPYLLIFGVWSYFALT